jgi:L-alanine-DL-glutamate epimerase-like enolase superfamily enzyme
VATECTIPTLLLIKHHFEENLIFRPHNIFVASGEMIANRVMFKQFMQAGAFEFCQVDSARIGGVNELLIVYLMARKFNIKVCPHAGLFEVFAIRKWN